MQSPFDIYAGQFSVGELAELTGVSRPIIDVWCNRGVIEPTRRERPTGRKPRPRTKSAKAARPEARRGRPLFSCRDVFTASLVRTLAERLAMGSTDSSRVAGVAKLPKDLASKLSLNADAAGIASVAAGGEWMWACARGIERGKPLIIYGYASRVKGKWEFDMHVGLAGAEPRFGWHTPHLFVPMSAVFAEAYGKCKTLLASDASEGR
jgi:hypothetical protein